MNAVDIALYSKLSGDATLASLTGGRIGNGMPPQGTALPYLMFQEQAGNDLYTYSRRAAIDLSYMVKAVATATASQTADEVANSIRERADAVLTDAALTVTGYRVGWHRRASLFAYEEFDGGVRYYHAGMTYRLRLFP